MNHLEYLHYLNKKIQIFFIISLIVFSLEHMSISLVEIIFQSD
jgi:hypothetical protein